MIIVWRRPCRLMSALTPACTFARRKRRVAESGRHGRPSTRVRLLPSPPLNTNSLPLNATGCPAAAQSSSSTRSRCLRKSSRVTSETAIVRLRFVLVRGLYCGPS